MIKVNNEVVKLDKFPDGTYNIKGNPELNYGEVLVSWHYQNDAEFMAVAFLTKYYQARNNKVSLYLPYVPNARMDRIEDGKDILTIKYFGELINSLNFETVFVMDVHSSVTVAIIKNCHIITVSDMTRDVFDYITVHEGHRPIMFYPDEGAMKRYYKKFNVPFAFGMKRRNWSNGQILGLDVLGINPSEIRGKSVLIRDDICSKGGTFYYAAKKLKEMGAANIYLMVTHCEESIHHGEFGEEMVNLLDTGLINHVFTTDSIYSLGDSEKVTVFKTDMVFNNDCECCCECEEEYDYEFEEEEE